MKSIIEDIKTGDYKSVYLFYGEENYLKQQYKKKLIEALIPQDDTVNFASFEGKDVKVEEIMSLGDTMPFFAERRLIVVENSGFLKQKSEELASYIPEIPESAVLLFVESEVDKRGKVYKAITKKGRAVDMSAQDEKSLIMWLASLIKGENKKVKESTLRYFIGKAGHNMDTLKREMDKVISYALYEDEITPQAIDAVVTNQIENHIFDMVEAVSLKKQKEALRLYYELLALKEPPMRILYMLSRQFKQLLEVKGLRKQGYDKGKIAKAAGIHPFVVGKLLNQVNRFRTKELISILEGALESEKAVKVGDLKDTLSVELFIVKNSAS
ncbi:DNA polymerase-3 subunit delta [Aequitasia blattaphilus]|uniref:DNA polymerase III subunit delta n=1 Tax=Aequitasia blattaphilus TaxID=2949332 RepID=A0ABT1EBH8_9FIRM|nr:DNA polymerase III subunit delta [Aequitasia blattaphilus]MCP1102287.1 DNA polymerase III subunit delta [Aequitasia blattaphilus]MCR8614927.1 DNA polymerase III subunit delta [Aequitasia blattaphilus]